MATSPPRTGRSNLFPMRIPLMQHVIIDLHNCYGIKSLHKDFDFSDTQAYALYAPNGIMKSSLAKTFQDVVENRDSQDRIFSNRTTTRDIIDEHHNPIAGRRIFVIFPYDQEFGVNEQTSTLLLDRRPKGRVRRFTSRCCRRQASPLNSDSQSICLTNEHRTRNHLPAIMPTSFEFDAALIRIKREVEDLQEVALSDVEYDTIFSETILKALNHRHQ